MPKPDVVLDTNVLVSSLWRGAPFSVVKRWRDGQLGVIISPAILREYLDVLSRFTPATDVTEWARLLSDPRRVTFVEPRERIGVIRDDPSDNRFLECAVTGNADAIVSGDRHLLNLGTFRSIPIVSPAAFLEQFSS